MRLFSLIFSVCMLGITANCFFLIGGNGILLGACIAVFILLSGLTGLFSVGTKSRRLRWLCHGTVLLLAFCVSVTLSVVLNLLLLTGVIPCEKSVLLGNVIYCIVAGVILFWVGIICVYLTSVQLGIKTRLIGILCGMIPIAHLFALRSILKKAYGEVRFETEKERINKAREKEAVCKTKYPILLVHGVFFRDFKHFDYWGRIPEELRKNGAVCHYGNHQSALSVKESGEELAERIRTLAGDCGKVNIIAHSKGGLDCRYALKNCGAAPYVASLTTVNTPHRGCLFADWLLKKAPDGFKAKVASAYNSSAKLLGDKTPDFLAAVGDLTAEASVAFDRETPCPEGVFCQSIGSVMHSAASGKFPLNLSHNFVKHFDGENDGLVGKDSFSWGERYTLLDLPLKRGISHGDMIDLNRENIEGFDVREFYVNLVGDLKNRGL